MSYHKPTRRVPAPAPVRPPGMGEGEIRPCGMCLRCVSVCPSGALRYQHRRWQLDLSICIYCGGCRSVCPNPLI